MSISDQADAYFRDLQLRITSALEAEDGGARFRFESWQRSGGGGGLTGVIENGALFEKGGVNISTVFGEFTDDMAAQLPGDGREFFATGISLVLHPKNPFVPTTHTNFRCLRRGSALWFGGGADLTPTYFERDDAVHFHQTFKTVCDQHDAEFYPRFKKWCDEYFFLPHRQETRGIGGIFFDYLQRDPERDFAFVKAAGDAFLDAYFPIVRRRKQAAYSEREREFQLYRRGRYVEFNLLYDRGTMFGLKTGGRTESILMSLPPLVRWGYDVTFPPGSREASLSDWLKPHDWLQP